MIVVKTRPNLRVNLKEIEIRIRALKDRAKRIGDNMKIIGLVTPSHIAKAKKVFDFVDEILEVENLGLDKTLHGQRAEYDRIKVTYKFKENIQVSNISAQWGTSSPYKRK